MAGAIKGITVEIGGSTTKLDKALSAVNGKTKSLQNELKGINTLLKFDSANPELLAQKQEVLTAAIAETTAKLDILKEAESQVKAQFESGEIGAEAFRDFQREVIVTQSRLESLNSDLEATRAAASDLGSGTDDATSSLDNLTDKIKDQESKLEDLKTQYTNVVLEQGKNSREAKELASEMSSLNDDLKANKDELAKAEKEAKKFADALDDTGDSAQNTDGGFTVMKGALGDLVANAISSAISAIGDLIGSLLDLSEATEEYRSMQGKLAGSADSFGYSVDFANEKYKQFYSYIGDDQAATNAITNLMGLGTSTESVSKLAEGAIGVWASYGDSIPIESLTESINETAQVGKITGTMADTLNWATNANETFGNALSGNKEAQKAFNDALEEGLPVEDAANEALAKISDTQERADVIAQFLNDTYGESKTTYDELNGSITDANEAELKLKDTQAQLGEAVQPVNTALTTMKDQALTAITPLVQSLADGFMNLYNWLQANPTAMTILTAVVIALAAAFGVLATALAIQGIITGVTKAIAFLNTTLLANPIVLIVAAIAGLVAAFIYLWNNCEAFRNFWINLWANIKSIASSVFATLKNFFTVTIPQAIDTMVTFFSELPGKIWTWLLGVISRVVAWGSNLVNSARTAASNMINSVVSFAAQLPGRLYTAISGAVSRVVSWGASIASAAGNAIRNMGSRIVNIAKSIPSKFISIGRDIIEGIKSGITGAVSGLYSKIKESLSGLVDKAKEALGINSPSKVFAEVVGKAIPEGIAKGVVDNTELADDSVNRLTDDISDQAVNLNGATLNRKLSATFTAANARNDSALLSKLDRIYDRLDRLQIVLDSGVLVGETVDQYDRALANRQLLSARGV